MCLVVPVASTHLFGAHGLKHPLQQDPQLLNVVQEDAGLHTQQHPHQTLKSKAHIVLNAAALHMAQSGMWLRR